MKTLVIFKKTLLSIIALVITSIAVAQNGFNYKALISDNGNVLANQVVSIKFTILENGSTAVYQETQTGDTDTNGIIAFNIGEGAVVSGDFSTIDWGSNTYFLKVEIDTGSGYQDFGTSELKYVPYAKYADKAGNVFSGDFNDLTNVPVGLSDGDDVNDADHDPANELQDLSLSGTQLNITNGTGVDFTNWDTDSTDDVQAVNDLSDAKTTANSIFLGNNSGTNVNGNNQLVGVGYNVMPNVTSANYSVGIGNYALNSLTSGNYNVAIGHNAGQNVTTKGYNVYIGHNAGRFATGRRNVFIGYQAGRDETGNEKLYIDNSSTPNPLIYGDFLTNELTINGSLAIKDGTQGAGKIFMSDTNGNGHWSDLPAQNKILTLGPVNATVINGNVSDYLVKSAYNGAYITNNSIISGIVIPINLPANVQITTIVIFYKDNTANNYKIKVLKSKINNFFTTQLDNFVTSGNINNIRTHTVNISETVDNSYQYFVIMHPVSGDHWSGTSNSALKGIKIFYTE